MANVLDSDPQKFCQLAIANLCKLISIRYPQYPNFAEKFKAQCIDEEFDEIDIVVEDFGDGYDESSILPGISDAIGLKDEDKEALCKSIHYILTSFSPAPLSLNLFNIIKDIDEKEITKQVDSMKDIVIKQAMLLNPDNVKDTALLKVLILGKQKYFPLLSFLSDTYGRWRLLKYQKLYEALNEYEYKSEREQFIGQYFNIIKLVDFMKDCHAMKTIQKEAKSNRNKKYKDALAWFDASLNSFFRRITFPLKIGPKQIEYKINDSMPIYTKYFLSILIATKYIIQSPVNELPVQIDFWLIPRAMKKCVSDEEEDPDDPDDEKDMNEEKEDRVTIDDLQKRLQFTDALHNETIERTETLNLSRVFYDTFEKIVRHKRSKRMVILVDRRIDGKDVIDNKRNYSKVLIEQKDELYAYLPQNAQDIPSGQYLHESLFNLTRQEILPSDDGKVQEGNNAIHGSTSCLNMFMLSIHIHQEDVVRAYWYINGTATRFFLNDILDIWPYYFIETATDEETETDILQNIDKLKGLLKSKQQTIRETLQDESFDRFFEENTRIKPSYTYAKDIL